DVDLMVLHALAHVVEGERSACCVSVNTQYARSGKPLPEYLFNALCAMTCRRQIQVTAARTCPYHRLLVPAVVTAQMRLSQMQHQTRRAARTGRTPAAREACQRGSVAAAIDEHQALFV